MSQVFELDGVGPTHRLLLLALADHADDDGRCYPSLSRLCRRTGLTERAVRKNLRDLEAAGHLRTEVGTGPKGSNTYHVTPRHELPPARKAPRHEMPHPPAPYAPPPRHDVPPNHHITINEPSNDARASFSAFWDAVPQKIGKANAEKAWKRLGEPLRVAALANVKPYFEWWRKQHPDASWLHPATYLNQRRWADEGWRPTTGASVDKAAFWAESIKAGRFVSPAACPPAICREMIERGLVSQQQLAEKGLVA